MIKINNTAIKVPMPELKFRKRHQGVFKTMHDRGCSNVVSIIAANRTTDISARAYQDLVKPSIGDMDLWKLKDIDIAADRILKAKRAGEHIALVTDFDVDGISSAVVMRLALVEYMGFDEDKVKIRVNYRMKLGYGFSLPAMEAMFENSGDNPPTLVITADQGSNDSETVRVYKERMAELGYEHADVIVTDHHHIDEGNMCPEALAFVNPQRPDDDFEDPTICGCMVALLVMSAARAHMVSEGELPSEAPNLGSLLMYACLATVADCVSLKSGINRFVIRRGLKDINNEVIPAWHVLKRKVGKPADMLTAQDLAFKLGPAINADSRTGGDGSNAVNFLMSKTIEEANYYYEQLNVKNNRRKDIELAMLEAALEDASVQYYEKGMRGLSVYLPNGSHGIHGIVASRIKERFNCPAIVFSPSDRKETDSPGRHISGSGRCIDRLSIVDIVKKKVEPLCPSIKSGGHPAAMGLTIELQQFSLFQELFDRSVKEDAKDAGMDDGDFYPRVMVDHLIKDGSLQILNGLTLLNEQKKLEPYGQRFEAPIFAINGKFSRAQATRTGEHMTVFFIDSLGNEHSAMCFFHARQPWLSIMEVGQEYTFAVTVNYDKFKKKMGMLIEGISEGFNNISR
ncbi:single-stranded-DNA-specific exonuclease RecJ [Alteromonas sp. 14N.309.X.WAT.G.H12]|uniref:single-stranded-DNA-specific exonuclease RecJ n=1 Tax=Alteromonas sp. 14N.309.X.WAT.G.H12 TaxID=3120824 RepID=UPI002FD650B7